MSKLNAKRSNFYFYLILVTFQSWFGDSDKDLAPFTAFVFSLDWTRPLMKIFGSLRTFFSRCNCHHHSDASEEDLLKSGLVKPFQCSSNMEAIFKISLSLRLIWKTALFGCHFGAKRVGAKFEWLSNKRKMCFFIFFSLLKMKSYIEFLKILICAIYREIFVWMSIYRFMISYFLRYNR